MNDLEQFAAENGIRHYMVSYTDLLGVQRAKLVPATAIGQMVRAGATFAGFATWLDMTAADADLVAFPCADSVVRIPWQPEVAWLPANCWVGDAELAQAPRNILCRLVAEAAEMGYTVKTGVEPEFFLLQNDGREIADTLDTARKPCYDQQALMRRYDVVGEMIDHMHTLGWKPYQCDHEDANGQFEMNWQYDGALATADRHSFFKFMARSVAERHDLRATFMPKPFEGLTGSGCHVHVSLWDKDGQNVFHDPEAELGLSEIGRNFLGGIMVHGTALAAICNPTVNSYKRINAPRTSSGSTWAPNSMTWSGNNRTHMVRVPGAGRFELRLPDGAANPYLLQAAIIAAGIDGLRRKLDPGPRYDIDMYAEGHLVTDAPKLPRNLLDALREYDRDEWLKQTLGSEFSEAYLKLKRREWESYASHYSEWERQNTLDI